MKQSMIIILICAVCLCGCAPYYRVTDPSTENTYYTRNIKKVGSGAIKLEDARSGKTVTLQNSIRGVDHVKAQLALWVATLVIEVLAYLVRPASLPTVGATWHSYWH